MTTFTYKDVTAHVRHERVRDRLNADVIESKLAGEMPDELFWAIRQFALFCTTVEIDSGELSFDIPSATANSKELVSAFDEWMDCDAALIDAWQTAQIEVATSKKTTEAAAD